MGAKTGIEWTRTLRPDGTYTEGASWNPLIAYNTETEKRGWFCVHAGEDCKDPDGESGCYAESINTGDIRIAGAMIGNGLKYVAENLDKVRFELINITKPWSWRGHPRKIFVESMGDIFLPVRREGVPLITYEMRRAIFEEMRRCKMHTFIFLTKHPGEAEEFITRYRRDELGMTCAQVATEFAHVHFVVSAGNQKRLEQRGPKLLMLPFEVRMLSLEPLIGPVDLSVIEKWPYVYGPRSQYIEDRSRARIQGVLVGGESYHPNPPAARALHPDWPRAIDAYCQAHGMDFFWKQWGEYAPWEQLAEDVKLRVAKGWRRSGAYQFDVLVVTPDGRRIVMEDKRKVDGPAGLSTWVAGGDVAAICVGKRRAGRLLDGRERNDYPVPDWLC